MLHTQRMFVVVVVLVLVAAIAFVIATTAIHDNSVSNDAAVHAYRTQLHASVLCERAGGIYWSGHCLGATIDMDEANE